MRRRMAAMAAGAIVLAGPVGGALGEATWDRSDWRANVFTMSTQSQSAMAVAPDGSMTVVWSSRRQQSGQYGVYARRFGVDGAPLGPETRVNLWTRSHQWRPAVATASGPDPSTWVVWQSHGQDGEAGTIVGRVFDAAGQGGSEILVNTDPRGHQMTPVVAAGSRGEALAAWVTVDRADGGTRLDVRALGADGAAGPVRSVSTTDGAHPLGPSLAPIGDDYLLVYAERDATTGVALGIRGQRLAADGSPIGLPLRFADDLARQPIEPVVRSGDEGVAVAWVERDATGTMVVRVMRCDEDGVLRGVVHELRDATGRDVSGPAIAIDRTGSLAVSVTHGVGADADVMVHRFDPAGRPQSVVTLTAATDGRQTLRAAAGTSASGFAPDGSLLVAWEGDGDLGDGSAVHVTRQAPWPLPAAIVRLESAPEDDAALIAGAAPHVPPAFDPKRRAEEAPRDHVKGLAGIGFTGIFDSGWCPPDPELAVGPDHVVVMTNGAIAFFTKDGTLLFQDEIEDDFGFWGEVGASGFIFDPECVYDPLSQRFFAMAADWDMGSGTSWVLIAVSDDANPEGTWFKYRLETTGLAGSLFDSPNLGVDATTVYITGDGFGGPAAYPVFTFDKASLLAGNPPAIALSASLATSTQSAGIPPVVTEPAPALYMAEHEEGSNNTSVRLIALRNPLTGPTFTTFDVTVPSYGPPEDPPQAGSSVRPNTFDARFWSVAYRNGSLWATHHVNASRVRVRWYEFAMNGWPTSGQNPTLRQSGEIDPGGTVRTFFTAIDVDAAGNATLVYSRSAPNEAISIRRAFRFTTDPLGTFQPGQLVQSNTGAYTSGRWGDYAGIGIDPSDGKTVWTHHEYAVSGSWRTWIDAWTPPFPIGDVNCDGAVGFQDLVLLLASWGPCPGCPADLDGNGVVDFADLVTLLSAWTG